MSSFEVITRTFAWHRVCLMIQSASSRAAAAYGWPTRAAVSGSAPWVSNNDMYADTLTVMKNDLSLELPLIGMKPTQWPAVTVDVRRVATWDGFYNIVYVRQVDPITGHMFQVNFPVGGTTLRGARMQRTSAPTAPTDFWWTPGKANLDG